MPKLKNNLRNLVSSDNFFWNYDFDVGLTRQVEKKQHSGEIEGFEGQHKSSMWQTLKLNPFLYNDVQHIRGKTANINIADVTNSNRLFPKESVRLL